MLQFVFDTDHLTLFQHHHPVLMGHFRACPQGAIGVSPVSVEEVFRGWLAMLRRAKTGQARIRAYAALVDTVETLQKLPIVAYDQHGEDRFQSLCTLRPRIGTQDLKIAAVALANNLIVLTRNSRDFSRVPGLTIADWTL